MAFARLAHSFQISVCSIKSLSTFLYSMCQHCSAVALGQLRQKTRATENRILMQSSVPFLKQVQFLACRFYELLLVFLCSIISLLYLLSATVPLFAFSCNFKCFFTDRFLFDGSKQPNWDLESSRNIPEFEEFQIKLCFKKAPFLFPKPCIVKALHVASGVTKPSHHTF